MRETVRVVCDSDAHPRRRQIVGTFELLAMRVGGDVGEWWLTGNQINVHATDGAFPGHESDPADAPPGTYDPDDWHSKYELHCELCGYNFKRRIDVVDPIMRKLVDHGVPEIPLARLAAIIDAGG